MNLEAHRKKAMLDLPTMERDRINLRRGVFMQKNQ